MVLLRSNTSLARDAIRAVVAAPSDGATQQQHQHEAAKAWARSKTATMPKLTTVASAFKSHRDLAVEEGRQSRLTGSTGRAPPPPPPPPPSATVASASGDHARRAAPQ